jgi:hypothetical protein
MRRGRGSWWWAQMERALVYVALGIVSAGVAFWVNSKYSAPSRLIVFLTSWVLGMLIIDIRIESKLATEEELKDGVD